MVPYLWLEVKYLQLLSPRFENFKKKDNNLWNLRCCLCGDSQKNKRKARGYFYEREGSLRYHCHNCSIDTSFKRFLKSFDPRLYSEFQIEKLRQKKVEQSEEPIKEKETFDSNTAYNALMTLPLASTLQCDHPAKKYLKQRQLPVEKFRWTDNFMRWTNLIIPKKFDGRSLRYDHGRVIIPFFNRDNHFFAYQGRAIDDSTQRYISICLNEEAMLYGMNWVNFNHDIFVTEGPIDSMFLKNSIAIAGSNYFSLTKQLPRDRIVMIWDNEPRKPEIKKKMLQTIKDDLRLVIWPNNIVESDINKMIIGGMSSERLQDIVNENTYQGMTARMKLNKWCRA